VRGIGLDDPPLPGRRALPKRPPAANPHPRSAGGLWRIPTQELLAAGLRPRQARLPDQAQKAEPSSRPTAGQPGADRVRELEHALELERTVAEPPRTWPPSEPTRSRPWKAPWRRCKFITLPRRPAPTAPLPHQRRHRRQPTQSGQPAGQACCRWCRGEGRPSANSARRRRRRSSGGYSAGNVYQSGAGANQASDDATAIDIYSGRVVPDDCWARTACAPSLNILSR